MQIITDANPSTRNPKRRACAALFALLQVNDGQAAVAAGEFAGCNIAHGQAMLRSTWLVARPMVERRTQLHACNRTLSSAEAV